MVPPGNAAISIGICEGTVEATAKHLTGGRLEHLGASLSSLPTLRARLAQMRIETDKARAHLAATIDAAEAGSEAAQLLVLESKTVGAEAAIDVTDMGCGLAEAPRSASTSASSGTSGTHGPPPSWRRRPTSPTSSSAARSAAWSCSNDDRPILVGAVLYDPKVSVIWDIIRDFFEAQGCPIDVVFYTNYELQVEALTKGHVDIAWNSPLAWVDSVRQTGGTCRAIAMRDTDRDRVSHVVVKADSGIEALEDLRGKTLAVGAKDSPQATLIPIGMLQRAGLEPGRDFEVKRFDLLVGKHGDHVGGELEAFRCLAAGEADASACWT